MGVLGWTLAGQDRLRKNQQNSLSAADEPVKFVSQGWVDFNRPDSSGERVLLGFGSLGLDLGRPGSAPEKPTEITLQSYADRQNRLRRPKFAPHPQNFHESMWPIFGVATLAAHNRPGRFTPADVLLETTRVLRRSRPEVDSGSSTAKSGLCGIFCAPGLAGRAQTPNPQKPTEPALRS